MSVSLFFNLSASFLGNDTPHSTSVVKIVNSTTASALGPSTHMADNIHKDDMNHEDLISIQTYYKKHLKFTGCQFLENYIFYSLAEHTIYFF